MSENLFKTDHPLTASILSKLGKLFLNCCDWKISLSCLNKAYEMNKRIYKSENEKNDHIQLSKSLSIIGDYYLKSYEFEEAYSFYNESFEMNKRMFKDNQNHPDIADSFSNFGHYYLKNGNLLPKCASIVGAISGGHCIK